MQRSAKGKAMQSEILCVLHGAEQPMSAYDLLAVLRRAAPRLAPTTVYRALKALCASGQVLRIESLSAYALRQTEPANGPVILSICDDCGTLRESAVPDLLASLAQTARQAGIEPTHHVVEIHGQCSDCSAAQPTKGCQQTAPDTVPKHHHPRGIHDQ